MLVLPGRSFSRLDRVSRLLFHFRAEDLDWRTALTGQSSAIVQTGRASIASGDDVAGHLVLANHSQLRFTRHDYDADGLFERPGVLSEGPRTNLLLRSEELGNAAWTNGGGVTVTTDVGYLLSPHRTLTVEKLDFTTTTATNYILQTYVIADPENRTFVFSILIHDGFGSGLLTEAGDGFQVTIRRGDTSDGSTFSLGNAGLKVWRRYGNGWTRYWCSKTFSASAVGDDVQVLVRSNGVTGHYFAWGTQLEESKSPSTYIPTVAATVQRVDEGLAFNVDWTNFQHPNITIYWMIGRPLWAAIAGDTGVVAHGFWDLGDAGNNHIWCYADGVGSNHQIFAGIRGATTDRTPPTVNFPAGDPIEMCVQAKDLLTAPAAALDVGAGYGAFSTPTEIIQAFANPRIRVGGITNASGRLFGGTQIVKVGSGLLSMAQLRGML